MTKRETSWDHAVKPVSVAHIQSMKTYNENHPETRYGYRCGRGCPTLPTWYKCYTYITGAKGRTTRAERLCCESCARCYAEKHHLVWPTETGVSA